MKIMNYLKTAMTACGAVLILASCTMAPPAGRAAVNSFAHIQPLSLNVSDIQIFDDFQPTMTDPYIEHTMVNPPYRAAYNMTQRAFTADGIEGVLEVHITDAGIRQTDRQVKQNNLIKTREHFYEGALKAEVILISNDSIRQEQGRGQINVARQLSVPASMSMTQREMALNGMVEKLVMDYHTGLVDILEDDFQLLLKR